MLQTRGSSPGELWSRRRRSGLRGGTRRKVDRASGGPKHCFLIDPKQNVLITVRHVNAQRG